ncbi:MAG: glycosyltransferase [Pyrinomonadaceae bacterium]
MKVLRIIARLNVGGPARHVVWLNKNLQDDEFRSVLIAGNIAEGEDDMGYFAAQNGVAPIYIEDLSRELSLKDLSAARRIYRQIKLYAPDIIHTHTAKAGTLGRLVAFAYRWLTWSTLVGRPRQIKIVHTFHGHIFHSYYGKLKTRIYLTIEKLLAKFATDKIVVISQQQLREINQEFNVGKNSQFSVIPLGIDFENFPQSNEVCEQKLREEIGASDNEIIVGFLGRLTEIKNVSLLLNAAALSASTEMKLRFIIVGDGQLRARLEAESRSLGLRDRVTFLGHRSDVLELIAGMDIVALSSLNEGTPLSLIEAMASGVPVVATGVGGVVDLLGEIDETKDGFDVCHRGIMVQSGNAPSLCDGLMFLAQNDTLRKTLSQRGKKFVRSEYSIDRLTNDMRDLYRALISV